MFLDDLTSYCSAWCAVIVVGLYLLWYISWVLYRNLCLNLPPSYGICYPFFGHLLYFRGVADVPATIRDKCNALKSPLVFLRLAGIDAVVMCDYKLTVKAFVGQEGDFSDRAQFPIVEKIFPNTLPTSDATPLWKIKRKLILESLRKYANGTILEEHAYDAVDKMATVLHSEKAPFNPQNHFFLAVYHVLTMICFDKTFNHDDPTFQHLVDLELKTVATLNEGTLSDFISLFNYFPFRLVDFNQTKAIQLGSEYRTYILNMFEERRRNFDGNNPRCLVDHLLAVHDDLKTSTTDLEERSALNEMTMCQFVSICIDVYAAGVETTSHTMNWFVYYMALHPDVQEKLRSHINEVLGSRRPKLSDRMELSYFRAVLREVMRLATVVPLGLPHRTKYHSKLAGYDIPAYSMVICNQWAVHHDPAYWGEDVDQFRPERFLDGNGKLAPTPDSFLPFSCGRRTCPGQSLAQQELLLLLPPLFQRFQFRFPHGCQPPELDKLADSLFIRNTPAYSIEVVEV